MASMTVFLIIIDLLKLSQPDHFRMDSDWRWEMANPPQAIRLYPMPHWELCERYAARVRSKTTLAYCINVGTGK